MNILPRYIHKLICMAVVGFMWILGGQANVIYGASTATASAFVINGFVVSINVTSGGSGYTEDPKVTIAGGGGAGATAKAVLANGSVSAILVLSAGSGYTSTPSVSIESPVSAFSIDSIRMVPLIELRGVVGIYSQVQHSEDLSNPTNWIALTNITFPSDPYFLVDTNQISSTKRFYRVLPFSELPIPQSGNSSYVWIPSGNFVMGSPANELDRTSMEGPLTKVTISKGFWINKYPLTQQEYKDVMGVNPSSHNTGNLNLPVENVSWYNAVDYCTKLTKQERAAGRLPNGYVYRLPTEAEWEYACRAGSTSRFYFGDDLSYSQLENYIWYSKNSGGQTHPVGSLLPNQWGLYDMLGNVAEWCSDWFAYSYSGGSVTDPKGPTVDINSTRVVRGASYAGNATVCRAAIRGASPQNSALIGIGFRPVLALADAEHAY